jgi:hypothetical protein
MTEPEKLPFDPNDMPPLARYRYYHPFQFDVYSIFVYTWIVYAWSILIHPMGRDYLHMAHPSETMPPMVANAFQAMLNTFGDSVIPYHVTNVLLLYLCTMLVYMFIVPYVGQGIWLASWGAVMFMANPVHTESVANLSGIVDLLPCVAALAALVAYQQNTLKPRAWLLGVALALYAFAGFAFPSNAFLGLVFVLYEYVVLKPEKRQWRRMAGVLAIGAGSIAYHYASLWPLGFNPAHSFAPLYFIAYPIGFLPENAAYFHLHPWVGWVAAAAVLGVAVLVVRKSGSKIVLLCLLAMVAIRLYGGTIVSIPDRSQSVGNVVDPVHLTGGGQLILPCAFFSIALALVALAVMKKPNWRVTAVSLTTVMAAAIFLLEVITLWNWREAGKFVAEFQGEATTRHQTSKKPVGILPAWRHYQGAPVDLASAITFDTPFNERVPSVPLLPLDLRRGAHFELTIDKGVADSPPTAKGWDVRVAGRELSDMAPWPYDLAHRADQIPMGASKVDVWERSEKGFLLRVSTGADLPGYDVLPGIKIPGAAMDGDTAEN